MLKLKSGWRKVKNHANFTLLTLEFATIYVSWALKSNLVEIHSNIYQHQTEWKYSQMFCVVIEHTLWDKELTGVCCKIWATLVNTSSFTENNMVYEMNKIFISFQNVFSRKKVENYRVCQN